MTRAYPFSEPEKLDIEPLFEQLRTEEPLSRVTMPYGEPAWLATRYEDVKVVLGDPRFSRAAATGRDEPRLRTCRRRATSSASTRRTTAGCGAW